MPSRSARAHWEGSIKDGGGSVAVDSGVLDAPYSFGSRFESGQGTNPEELLGAAHAGCFTMALSLALTEAGHAPTRLDTTARVTIERTDQGFRITHIDLESEGEVPGIDASEFERLADGAKTNCPVSRALAGTEIGLQAKLVG